MLELFWKESLSMSLWKKKEDSKNLKPKKMLEKICRISGEKFVIEKDDLI